MFFCGWHGWECQQTVWDGWHCKMSDRWTVRCLRACVQVMAESRALLHSSTKARRPWLTPCTRTPSMHSEHSTCAFLEIVTWLPNSEVSTWCRQPARRRHCRTPLWQSGVSVRTITAGASAMTALTARCCLPGFSTTPASSESRPCLATETKDITNRG